MFVGCRCYGFLDWVVGNVIGWFWKSNDFGLVLCYD